VLAVTGLGDDEARYVAHVDEAGLRQDLRSDGGPVVGEHLPRDRLI
jgi:hypothetical protein